MATAKKGDTVSVSFTGKIEDGEVFAKSSEQEPLEFVLGDGQILPGLEQAVEGMSPGESKTATIGPEKAYGERNPDMVLTVERDKVPPEIDLSIGQQLKMSSDGQGTINVTVTGISEKGVTLDANHPLAGKNLVFDIELVAIR